MKTTTTTTTNPFYGPVNFVQDYPGEPVPEPIWILLKQENKWQWHQLGHMQICTLPQTDNHASTLPLSLLQAGCPSCCPTNSINALKAKALKLKLLLQPFYGPLDLVWDYPGELVPER